VPPSAVPNTSRLRPQTLRKPWQFRQVYSGGKKVDCKYAVLFYYRTGDSASGPSFGYVASKRTGNAVNRNRARRLLRQIAAHIAGRLKHRDLWLVFVARREITEVGSRDLLTDMNHRLEVEGLITLETP
jgi:ribonuclease P protein component